MVNYNLRSGQLIFIVIQLQNIVNQLLNDNLDSSNMDIDNGDNNNLFFCVNNNLGAQNIYCNGNLSSNMDIDNMEIRSV